MIVNMRYLRVTRIVVQDYSGDNNLLVQEVPQGPQARSVKRRHHLYYNLTLK
jgi:hypothetical protein